MSTFTTRGGTEIFYKDWGSGQPVVFSHGWPLDSDAWDAQMVFLGERGHRVVAHDRRGHGRSSQTWTGNDMDTYADDLDDDQIVPIATSALLSAKLVKNATLKIYRGGPHGLATTRANELNADLLEFIRAGAQYASAPSGGAPLTH